MKCHFQPWWAAERGDGEGFHGNKRFISHYLLPSEGTQQQRWSLWPSNESPVFAVLRMLHAVCRW